MGLMRWQVDMGVQLVNFVRYKLNTGSGYLLLVIISCHIISYHICTISSHLPFLTSFTFLSHFEKFYFTLCIKIMFKSYNFASIYFSFDFVLLELSHHVIMLSSFTAWQLIISFHPSSKWSRMAFRKEWNEWDPGSSYAKDVSYIVTISWDDIWYYSYHLWIYTTEVTSVWSVSWFDFFVKLLNFV